MAIIPEDLMDLAQEIVVQAESLPDVPRRDALCRDAVSRAYYAVYHAALALARRQGFEGCANYGSHEALWKVWFAEPEVDADLAADGNELRAERTRADYRLRETLSLARTRGVVDDAKRILNSIRERRN